MLINWWRGLLNRRPILANAMVYGTFYSAAELSQQTFNKYYTPEKPDYDFASAARIVGAGCAIYAPVLTVWYRFLDRKFVGTAVKTVATKVISDQLFMTPTLLAIFYVALATLEGREDIFAELRAKYWKTFLANQIFWIPAQTINFSFVSPPMRVAYVGSVSFIWINVLCFIKRQKFDSGDSKKKE